VRRLIALVALALTATCSGVPGRDGTAETQAPPSGAVAASPTFVPLVTPAIVTKPVAATPVVVGAPLDPVLMDVIMGKKIPTYKATYVVTGDPTGFETTRTQVFRTPEYRVDYTIKALGVAQTVVVLALKEHFYVCYDVLGRKQCLEGAIGDLEKASQQLYRPIEELQSQLGDVEVVRTADRQVAGVAGKCFDFRPRSGTTAFTPMTACYSAEGIPLRTAQHLPAGDVVMEATFVTSAVSDKDFAVPFPIQKLNLPTPTAQTQ